MLAFIGLLVDDRIDDDRGLAGLAVADDQLALAAADGDQCVDRLEPGLHRLVHRLARDDAGRLDFHAAALGGVDRSLAVDRIAEAIDHAAEQRITHRDFDDGAGAGDGIAFADLAVVAEYHHADIVGFEIERHAAQAGAGKLHHLTGHDVLQAEHAGDAVTDRQDLSGFGDIRFLVEGGNLLFQDLRNLGGTDLQHYAAPLMACCRRCRRDFNDVS